MTITAQDGNVIHAEFGRQPTLEIKLASEVIYADEHLVVVRCTIACGNYRTARQFVTSPDGTPIHVIDLHG